MRKILAVCWLLFAIPCVAQTYFGQQDTSSNATAAAGIRWNVSIYYQSSIAGTVTSLEAYLDATAGTGQFRIGLYDSAGTTLICEGNAATTTSTTEGWQTNASPTGACSVATGTNYTLAITFSSNDIKYFYLTGETTNWATNTTDYTAGMPASLPTVTPSNRNLAIRIGVTATSPPASSSSLMLMGVGK